MQTPEEQLNDLQAWYTQRCKLQESIARHKDSIKLWKGEIKEIDAKIATILDEGGEE